MRKIIILFHLYIFILLSCDNVDNKLCISNNTNQKIFYLDTYDSIITKNSYNAKEYYFIHYINSFEKKIIPCVGNINCWSVEINHNINKKLNLFIFYLDTLKKYNNIDSIIVKNRYAKRYSLSEEELNKMNWTITFDGK